MKLGGCNRRSAPRFRVDRVELRSDIVIFRLYRIFPLTSSVLYASEARNTRTLHPLCLLPREKPPNLTPRMQKQSIIHLPGLLYKVQAILQ